MSITKKQIREEQEHLKLNDDTITGETYDKTKEEPRTSSALSPRKDRKDGKNMEDGMLKIKEKEVIIQ